MIATTTLCNQVISVCVVVQPILDVTASLANARLAQRNRPQRELHSLSSSTGDFYSGLLSKCRAYTESKEGWRFGIIGRNVGQWLRFLRSQSIVCTKNKIKMDEVTIASRWNRKQKKTSEMTVMLEFANMNFRITIERLEDWSLLLLTTNLTCPTHQS